MKILFNGFRHSHINTLYNKAKDSQYTEIYACIEEDQKAREKACLALNAKFNDESYEELLKSDFEAVAIGLPYGKRGEAVIKALKAGKHVITDKPLCTTMKELDEIRSIVKEKNLKIACMLDLRYTDAARCAEEIIKSGELGEVRNVAFNGQHCIDYANRPSWYFEKDMHGGTVNDLAIHGIDLVRMITGKEFADADAVRTWNSYAVKNKDFRDCALIMTRLENGAGVLADVSYSAPSQVFGMPTYWEFRFWCEKGLLTFSYNDPVVYIYKEGCPDVIKRSYNGTETDYLTEFLAEIANNTTSVTQNVITSTETALLLQEEADKRRD